MHYLSAPALKDDGHRPGTRAIYYASAVISVVLAILGLASHHALLVAVVVLAVLAASGRLESIGCGSQEGARALVRSDGGSFPNTRIERPPTGRKQPRWVDGGALEHHQRPPTLKR